MITNLFQDIYTVPAGTGYLVHSSLRGITAFINQTALDQLINLINGSSNQADSDVDVSRLFSELSAPAKPPEKRSGPLAPFFLGLIPTRACNLSCRYCDFGSKKASTGRMSLNLAVSAVNQMAQYQKESGKEFLEIHFFGGEPLTAPDVVATAVHRARVIADQTRLVPHFEISTNGVFEKNRARFVGDYFDTVILSFDGLQDVHDAHRPVDNYSGSFKTVCKTASFLSKSGTELCFRCCISCLNADRIEETAKWFCENFRPAIINFETVHENIESRAHGIVAPDPFVFAASFVKARRIIESYGIRTVYAAATTDRPRFSFCPAGKDTLIVSPEGIVSSCYLPESAWMARGLDMKLGKIENNGKWTIDFEAVERLRNLGVIRPDRCNRCFCRWTCAGGCHVNQSYPGCPGNYNPFCIQTRIITACTLLEEMGLWDTVDRLLNNISAMQHLALNESDRPEDL